MDPLGMTIAIILGIMLVGGFAQASVAPQEPKVVYVVERKEPKVEEQNNSSAGLILFMVIIGLAIYFLN
jgi:hypothetical protein